MDVSATVLSFSPLRTPKEKKKFQLQTSDTESVLTSDLCDIASSVTSRLNSAAANEMPSDDDLFFTQKFSTPKKKSTTNQAPVKMKKGQISNSDSSDLESSSESDLDHKVKKSPKHQSKNSKQIVSSSEGSDSSSDDTVISIKGQNKSLAEKNNNNFSRIKSSLKVNSPKKRKKSSSDSSDSDTISSDIVRKIKPSSPVKRVTFQKQWPVENSSSGSESESLIKKQLKGKSNNTQNASLNKRHSGKESSTKLALSSQKGSPKKGTLAVVHESDSESTDLSDSESEEENARPASKTPNKADKKNSTKLAPSSHKGSPKKGKPAVVNESDSESTDLSDSESEVEKEAHASKTQNKADTSSDSESTDLSDSQSDEKPKSRKSKKPTETASKKTHAVSDSDDSVEDKQSSRPGASGGKQKEKKGKPAVINESDSESTDLSDSESEEENSRPARKTQNKADTSSESESTDLSDSQSEEEAKSRKARKQTGTASRRTHAVSDSDDSDEDNQSSRSGTTGGKRKENHVEHGREIGGKLPAKAKLRYQVPEHLTEDSDVANVCLTEADLKGKQFWLIQAPEEVNMSQLQGQELTLHGSSVITSTPPDKGEGRQYEVIVRPHTNQQDLNYHSIALQGENSLVLGSKLKGVIQMTAWIPTPPPVQLVKTLPPKHTVPSDLRSSFKIYGSVSPPRYTADMSVQESRGSTSKKQKKKKHEVKPTDGSSPSTSVADRSSHTSRKRALVADDSKDSENDFEMTRIKVAKTDSGHTKIKEKHKKKKKKKD